MQSLSFFVLASALSSATQLLLPLYQYPEGKTWDPVYSAIEAHPDVHFQIILNVDSGPGGSSVPNSDFVTGTSKLSSYPNVQTLGYVHCSYGEASLEEVNQNVTNWAAWNSYAGANITVGGIFFDETPNTEGGANDASFMLAVVGCASTVFGSHQFTSMLNPGSAVLHDEFWTFADFVVVFEADASTYSPSVLTTSIASGKAAQSSILIYNFASVGSESIADEWLQGMIAAGVGSAHILAHGYIQATTATAPSSISSVALGLAAVLPNAASPSVGIITSASSAPTTASYTDGSETESGPTLLTATAQALTTTAAVETTVASDTDTDETPKPLASSRHPTASRFGYSTRLSHTGIAGARHRHHHWRKVNGFRS